MHYKKRPWYEEIDPAFSKIIKLYLAAFHKIGLPAREGYLCVDGDEEYIRKLEEEHFPGIAPFYEQDKKQNVIRDFELIFTKLICFQDVKEEYSC